MIEFILFTFLLIQMLMRMESVLSLYIIMSVFASRNVKSRRMIFDRWNILMATWKLREIGRRCDAIVLALISDNVVLLQDLYNMTRCYAIHCAMDDRKCGRSELFPPVSLLCSFFIFSGSAVLHCFCRCKYTYAYLRTRSRKINRQARLFPVSSNHLPSQVLEARSFKLLHICIFNEANFRSPTAEVVWSTDERKFCEAAAKWAIRARLCCISQ